ALESLFELDAFADADVLLQMARSELDALRAQAGKGIPHCVIHEGVVPVVDGAMQIGEPRRAGDRLARAPDARAAALQPQKSSAAPYSGAIGDAGTRGANADEPKLRGNNMGRFTGTIGDAGERSVDNGTAHVGSVDVLGKLAEPKRVQPGM